MVQLARAYEQFELAGVMLWAISPQSPEKNRALRERYDLPFRILADEDQALIHAWGIYNHDDPKGRPIPHPATYLIAQDGTIAWAHLGKSTRDRPTVGQIIAAINELHGDADPA